MKGGSIRATRCQPRTNTRWIPPRTHIKMRLEELVGLLSTENGKRKSVLKRIASALEMDITQFDENSAKKVISTYLLEARDKNAIPRLVSLHEELCRKA